MVTQPKKVIIKEDMLIREVIKSRTSDRIKLRKRIQIANPI